MLFASIAERVEYSSIDELARVQKNEKHSQNIDIILDA